ncbi:MAG: hypothetical protein ACKVHE_16855 [Planctomycetales bacterium]|jgi:DNA gyrase/topoisomerase IV subunit A
MARIEDKTAGRIPGVFLVDENQLKELDAIVASRLKNLRKLRNQEISKIKKRKRSEAAQECSSIENEDRRNELIEAAVERGADRYPLSRDSAEWTVHFKSG